MYAVGHGVPQDYAEAVRWLRKAADQGLAQAQHDLGVMYANGQGVLQDYVEAHAWWNLAAAQGNEDAREKRDIIAQMLPPAQLPMPSVEHAKRWKRFTMNEGETFEETLQKPLDQNLEHTYRI